MNIPQAKRLASGLVAAAVFSISAAPSFAAEGTVGSYTFDARGTAFFEGAGDTGPLALQTPAGGTGYAYISTPFDLTGNPGFSASFEFDITKITFSGADGLVFVIQNDTRGLDAVGAGGSPMGYYYNVKPSVAVEFDTFCCGVNDPGHNHVDIAVNAIPSGAAAIPAFELESFAPAPQRFAWVDYDGTTLDVFLSETNAKPVSPLISKNIDIQTTVGNQAFIGFTSSTGGEKSVHRVFAFDIAFDIEEPHINVHPGGDPNPLNISSDNEKASTPVAILGSESLDVSLIDISLLTLASAGVKTVGKSDRELCKITEIGSYDETAFDKLGDPDEFPDLVCHFLTGSIALETTDTTVDLAIVGCTDPTIVGEADVCDVGDTGYFELTGTDDVKVVKSDL